MPQTKRFLVYVASNHEGLEVERYEVMRQLVRMGILCCGFPCREDSSPYDWNLTRSQIEDADLVIVVLGDQYGLMDPSGISYLHKEVVYAQSISKPVLSFIKNSPQTKQQTDDQRRLAGFQSFLSKGSYRLWHLREELVSLVKAGVASALSNKKGGWQKLSSLDGASSLPVSPTREVPTPSKLDNKQWGLQARQLIRLQFSGKVYEAGNNTLEEITLSQRWDALFLCVGETLKNPSSEDRLRQSLELLVKLEVKRRLLQHHPSAHAVDDIRLNKKQLQQLLEQWKEQGLVAGQVLAGRNTWQLTAEGIKRLAIMKTSQQAV